MQQFSHQETPTLLAAAAIMHGTPHMRMHFPMSAFERVPLVESQMLKYAVALVEAFNSRSMRVGPIGFHSSWYSDALNVLCMSVGINLVSPLLKYGTLLIFR
jgi:hypothetical protein